MNSGERFIWFAVGVAVSWLLTVALLKQVVL